MSSLADFDFFNKAVQSGMTEGQFVNAESILMAMGPPTLASMGSTGANALDNAAQGIAFPLGLIQQVSIGHNLAWQRIFEVGSKRSYFISGRPVGTIGIGRAYYHGPSLLRAAYAHMSKAAGVGSIAVPPLYDVGNTIANLNPHNVRIAPGSSKSGGAGNGNIWINLASDVFTQPIGALLIIRDSNDATVGAFYFEYCVVPNHGMQWDAQSVVLNEQMSLLFERCVPIDHTQLLQVYGAPGDDKHGIIGHAVGINT